MGSRASDFFFLSEHNFFYLGLNCKELNALVYFFLFMSETYKNQNKKLKAPVLVKLTVPLNMLILFTCIFLLAETLSRCRLFNCKSYEKQCEDKTCHGLLSRACCRRCKSVTCRFGKCWSTRAEKKIGRCGGWPKKNKCEVKCWDF